MGAKISAITGNTITALGLSDANIGNLVQMGAEGVYGEIISVSGENTVIQAYEETIGLHINDEITDLKKPLSIELGPGLLSNIFSGIGRRLDFLPGNFLGKGEPLLALDRKKKWEFKALKKKGDEVVGGDILGEVDETELIKTRIMVPPDIDGEIINISSGEFTVNQNIAKIKRRAGGTADINMIQTWPVKKRRPVSARLNSYEPFLSGQRVFDALFPINKGGTATLPGGFGVGKTISEQQFAKFSNTDISIYIGCGERGNEMADVLNTFPSITDPRSGKSIMNKTVLIANTSNMPIIAREASIFTGMTIAEFYRDMGYSVLLTADSTSRWAEALRQLGSDLGEVPVEEGFPASLFSSLASFYSRAGMVKALGSDGRIGSVTVISAVSPPGGDFSEPVTQTTLRLVDAYWELDNRLSNTRHYPPVNWTDSYSLVAEQMRKFYEDNVGKQFYDCSKNILDLLRDSDKINEIASIIGRDALPDKQAATLRLSDIIKLYFLQQNAFDKEDSYMDVKTTYKVMGLLNKLISKINSFLASGKKYTDIKSDQIWDDLSNLKHKDKLDDLEKEIDALGSERKAK